MESLESILSNLQGKYKDPNTSTQGKDEKTHPLPDQTSNPPIAKTPSSLDSLLNDLRNNSSSNFQGASPDANHVIDRDLHQTANQQKAKDQEAIAKTATAWLKKLDPLDGEGLWFEEFAKNYPSRLEAAIALLQPK